MRSALFTLAAIFTFILFTTTAASACDTTDQVCNVAADDGVSTNSVAIRWEMTASQPHMPDSFYVWRANNDQHQSVSICPPTNGNSSWTLVCQQTAYSNVSSYNCVDTNISAGSSRQYLVGSWNSGAPFSGNWSSCQQADIDRGFRAPPSPPTAYAVTQIAGGLRFSFTPSSTLVEQNLANNVFHRVYRTTQTTNNRCNGPASYTFDIVGSIWNDTTAALGTTYYYSVEARSTGGVSTCSNAIAGTMTNPSGYSISGTVFQADGVTGLAGVAVTAGSRSMVTGTNGQFFFDNLTSGNYLVVPQKDNYVFSPTQRIASIAGANVSGVNFQATLNPAHHTIRGRVFRADGTTGLAGIIVDANGTSAISDSSGNYAITGVRNGNYSVAASRPGYTFTGPVSVTINGGDVNGINFSALTEPTFSIRGQIRMNGNGPALSGATVSVGSSTTTTDANGNFAVSGLSPGAYVVNASRANYVITPGFSNPVTISIADRNGINFSAACATGYVLINNQCVVQQAAPSAPINLQASDGTEEHFVLVTWTASAGAERYDVYRSQFGGSIGAVIANDLTNTTYDDISAVPGVQYYYTAKAKNAFGESGFSNTDRGFRLDPSGEADCDGDGVSDAQEILDQTGVCDPGSFQFHLKSPAFTKYNTFLEQFNFLELIATGIRPINANITILALNGSVRATRSVTILPQQQIDIDIHSLVGMTDTYGVVKIDFNDEPGATLAGRMSNYRRNSDDTYSFAFAKELRNPSRGATFASANSIDPQGRGFLVANWAEIINLDSVPRAIDYRLYTQEGALVTQRQVTVPPLGELDIQAGHEFGEGVFLAEFRPIDGATRYFANISRYGYNNAPGQPYSDFSFAFPLNSRMGTGDRHFLMTTNTSGACWSQTNWAEVINTREIPVTASIKFRDSAGQVTQTTDVTLGAHSQYHFNATALLPKDTVGSLELFANEPGSLISQSAVYYHDCQVNSLQTSYASPGRISGQDVQSGTFNTNLGMRNLLRVLATSTQQTDYSLSYRSYQGFSADQSASISANQTSEFNSASSSIFSIPNNIYGTITLRANASQRLLSELVRVREVNGKVDFAMPTAVQ